MDCIGPLKLPSRCWCPGLDVMPLVVDVTRGVQAGDNVVRYQALYQGHDYAAQPAAHPHPNGMTANINLTSRLIVWR